MIDRSVAPFVLVEVRADGTEEVVSKHPTFSEGWSAGQEAVHADRTGAFSLYRRFPDRRVARFCHHRITAKNPAMNFEGMVIAL